MPMRRPNSGGTGARRDGRSRSGGGRRWLAGAMVEAQTHSSCSSAGAPGGVDGCRGSGEGARERSRGRARELGAGLAGRRQGRRGRRWRKEEAAVVGKERRWARHGGGHGVAASGRSRTGRRRGRREGAGRRRGRLGATRPWRRRGRRRGRKGAGRVRDRALALPCVSVEEGGGGTSL